MTNRFNAKGKTLRKVTFGGETLRKVNPEIIAKVLEAEEIELPPKEGLDLLDVRETLKQILHSKGGRPSLSTADHRVKIPRIDTDWVKLESLALASRNELSFKPSPAQVAAVVLHLALERIPEKEINKEILNRLVAKEVL